MKKINKKSGGISPVVAAVAGAVIGAGAVIAGAISLSKEENKNKLDETVRRAKDATGKFVERVKSEVSDKKEEAEKMIGEEKEVVRSAAIEVVDSIDKLAGKTRKQIKRI